MVKLRIVQLLAVVAVVCIIVAVVVIMLRHRGAGTAPMHELLSGMTPGAVTDAVDAQVCNLAKSPRGGRLHWGVDNAGRKVAYRFLPPARTPITTAQSNEIAVVFTRMAEAYRHGDRDALLACMNELPDVATNIQDCVFAKLAAPVTDTLELDFLGLDGRIPHGLKDFDSIQEFESYVRINLDVALFIGNIYLKRTQYDGPVAYLDSAVLKQLLLYKEKFHAGGQADLEKIADKVVDEWHEQIESENGFTRQYMWFQVDLQWATYNEGVRTVEQLSNFVKPYATGLIRLGYTPKWLSEFDDLSEAVK